MKPAFHHKLLNGPFGDPCLLVRISRERRSLLFDLGDIHALSPAALNRVTDVFVTHTHIDHFIGFDILLRSSLRRTSPITLYGPAGIIRNVEGKLGGYSWNLIQHYPVTISVIEYDGRSLCRASFSAGSGFIKQQSRRFKSDGLLLENPAFIVRAAVLDHGIPCLAFSLEEPFRLNIDKDRLLKRNLSVGPWLTDLKRKLREGDTGGSLSIGGKRYAVKKLLDIVRIGEGQKICFATDIGPGRDNSRKLIELAKNADIFYCEAYFREKERKLASERFHLTTHECGRIARLAGARNLYLMHFSPRYFGQEEDLAREVVDEFGSNVSW
jgi:ribonuclease Z